MVTAGRGRGWYRGDCHVHSARSHGGELTPEQIAAGAREAGLDFIAITEHDTTDTYAAWGPLAGDDLLVMPGAEVTTPTGHWLALGIRDEVVERQVDQVHRAGGICVVAHPYAPYPSGTFEHPFDGFDAVEVWNGLWSSDLAWNADNEAALDRWSRSLAAGIRTGRWQPALGDSDTHLAGQIGVPHTVVLAEQLSTEAVLAGIRAGRSWIAESATVSLSLTAAAGDRRAGIGERLATRKEPIQVRVTVSGVPSGIVSLHTDRGTMHRDSLPGDGSGTVLWHTDEAESAFVRVELRHPGGHMAALTNPIVLGDGVVSPTIR